MENRICDYRNCNKDISKMRPSAKYCSRNCKSCERKYDKREDNKIEKNKQEIVKLLKEVNNIKNIDNDILTLFNLINGKK
jgi:hypothetical protein